MKNNIKRHFYNNIDYYVDTYKKKVVLLPQLFEKLKSNKLWGSNGFKKIGGSMLGNILKVDQYKSPFYAFCHFSYIGLPVLDRKYVDAGIAIEPKVINLIKKVTGKKVKTFNPVKYNYNYFADKDDIIGGIPDGYIEDTKTVIEIKTTGYKNLENWRKFKVPEGYLRQAQLYAYLMGVKRFAIVATFLQEEDYLDPHNYPIEKRITKNWNYVVDIARVKDDIVFVKKWYKKYVLTGISPEYNETNDYDLLEWLKCSDETEWLNLKNKWIIEGKLVL